MKTKSRNLFKKISKKEIAELKNQRLEDRKSLSLAYQLGFYVGEQIVDKFLPTLSVDSIHTRKNISVTAAEGDECRRLDAVWFEKRQKDEKGSDNEWKALRAYRRMIEDKYLPKTVECHFTLLHVEEENMEEFKKGIGNSLWDCDASHYSTKVEDINVSIDEDGWFTIITLKKAETKE